MRTIERSTSFKRDFKRLAKGPFRAALLDDLPAIIEKLMIDEALDPQHRDHKLVSSWTGFRECHVKPDLLLIYRKVGTDLLQLARLGSHSELGI
jgi:mRNA interferase YafQ